MVEEIEEKIDIYCDNNSVNFVSKNRIWSILEIKTNKKYYTIYYSNIKYYKY